MLQQLIKINVRNVSLHYNGHIKEIVAIVNSLACSLKHGSSERMQSVKYYEKLLIFHLDAIINPICAERYMRRVI